MSPVGLGFLQSTCPDVFFQCGNCRYTVIYLSEKKARGEYLAVPVPRCAIIVEGSNGWRQPSERMADCVSVMPV